MAILAVPTSRLCKVIITSCDIDRELMCKACIESYTLYPTQKHNFVPDAIRIIYNGITYGEYDKSEAGIGISTYLDEDQLLTDLIEIHKKMSIIMLNNIQMLVKNVIYSGTSNDKSIFQVYLED